MKEPNKVGLDMGSIDQETLNVCKKVMHADLGSVKDLPVELANSLANLYYRFVCLTTDSCCEESVGRGRPQVPGLETAKALAAVEVVPQMINELRSIDRTAKPLKYRAVYELIIDYIKYDIKDANNKPLLMRIVERFIKKARGQVKELPDLISKLDFG
ncbi:MAG: hypothetical protein HQL06_11325 [Nitrospirae bacterium]|nr:hypothetical protein [Nitrospirota bacterium]